MLFFKAHYIYHSADGETVEWAKYQVKGEGDSWLTDKKFTYIEFDKVSFEDGIYGWHYQLRGDMGSKYSGHVTLDMNTGDMLPGPTNCH